MDLQSRSPNVSGAVRGPLRKLSGQVRLLGLAPFAWKQGRDVFSLEADHRF